MAKGTRTVVVAALMVAMSAAATGAASLEYDLALMMTWFEGEFDNHLQVLDEQENPPEQAHERIHSIFAPVDLPAFGAHLFYVEQYTDGDPTKIYRNRLYSFSLNEAEQAIQLTIYSFADAAAVVGAHLDPSRLAGVTPETARTMPGCEVYWKKDGDRFIGYMKEGACRIASQRLGKTIVIGDDLVLTADEIWIGDRAVDEDGNWVFGNRAGIQHQLKRSRPFQCWAVVQAEGAQEYTVRRGLALHDQGGSATIAAEGEGAPTTRSSSSSAPTPARSRFRCSSSRSPSRVRRRRSPTPGPSPRRRTSGSTCAGSRPVASRSNVDAEMSDARLRPSAEPVTIGGRVRRRIVLPWVVATVAAASLAGAPVRAAEPAGSRGFQEAVCSVSDLEGTARVFQDVAGWEIVSRGRAGADQSRFWRLDAGQEVHEVLLRNPGETTGLLRLVAFPGAQRQQIRSSAQPWDSGGIFDLNVRVRDIHRKFSELRERGWQFYSDPVRFQFGPFVVWEVLAKGPDGIVVAMVERVEPPLEGWPNLREMSHVFNSTQVVRDFERSRAFYLETLGFEVYLEHHGADATPGENVLGLPHNLAAEVPRRIIIMSPDGSNSGSVELIAFDGLTGADFAERAVPPNLGIVALRFPVADLGALVARLADRGVEPVAGPSQVRIEPYGEVGVMAIRSPEGAWLEFFESPATGEEDR